MKFLYFFFTVTLLLLQGCATNETTPDLNHTQVRTQDSATATTSQDITDNQTEEAQTEQIEAFEEEFSEEETKTTIDPFSGYNRVMTSFNDVFITYLLNPVSEGYAAILPEPLRIGVSNFITNIQFPIRFTNNFLQGKFKNSSDEVARFILNTTVGFGGVMDPATNLMKMPIPLHDEDFGQTLGHYGIGSGFHVVLPFFGPSNIRDIVGLTADAYISPLVNARDLENYKIPDNLEQSVGIITLQFINKTSLHLGEYESLKKDAIDLYPFFRDTYEQKRNSDIAE